MSDEAPAGDKDRVRAYWEAEPCGTRGVDDGERREFFAELERRRYAVDAHIPGFARFERGRDRDVLEIGVGAGTDFVRWVRHGARAVGVDLTEAGVELTRERLALEGLRAEVVQADAEHLPFADASFDLVYSYGVLHHTPDTARSIAEVHRVLRPGGTVLLMLYGHPSWAALQLWILHGLLRMHPLADPRTLLARHLESPGTKAYREDELPALLRGFSDLRIERALLAGDVLDMPPSAKYRRPIHRILWRLYPSGLVRRFGKGLGLGLLIEATRNGPGPVAGTAGSGPH